MKSLHPLSNVEKAISAIDKEITKKTLPNEGPMSLRQLNEFRQALYQMRDALQNNVPQEQRKITNLGRIIVDSWPLNSELGQIIIQAEEEFKTYK